MRGSFIFAAALLIACPARSPSPTPSSTPSRSSRVSDALDSIDGHLAQLRQDFDTRAGKPRPADVAWVKLRLKHLVELDQYLRTVYDDLNTQLAPSDQQALQNAIHQRLAALDAANTRELQDLLAEHGWFRISVFGEEADRDAWLLVQHADQDPQFQQRVLEILADLHPRGETAPSNFAYLFDRVAIAQGRRQRYGTQGDCIAGAWTTKPLEQPQAIDTLRASVGLPPLAAYEAIGAQICLGTGTT